jgi:hypothetical protein
MLPKNKSAAANATALVIRIRFMLASYPSSWTKILAN